MLNHNPIVAAQMAGEPLRPAKPKQFSHNGEDTIYHTASPNSFRFAFLVVTEYFDTPSEGVTKTLDFICNKLNEEETR